MPERLLTYTASMLIDWYGAGNYAKWFGTRGTLDAKSLSPSQKWVISGQGAGEPDKIAADASGK